MDLPKLARNHSTMTGENMVNFYFGVRVRIYP